MDKNNSNLNVCGDFNGTDYEVHFYDGSGEDEMDLSTEFVEEWGIDPYYDIVDEDDDFDYFAKAEEEDNSCPL